MIPPGSVIVIMAGGAGERFWPLSNRKTPKQLLRISGERTLLQAAYERAGHLVAPERVYIAAGRKLKEAIQENLPKLSDSNIIEEPRARNTAPCLGLAACAIEALHGGETVMGVLTADHLIDEGPLFEGAISAAMNHAAASGDLVTIGMQPTRPETAFGYVERGEQISTPQSTDSTDSGEPVYRVRRFTEKPDLATAERFLAKGDYLWNSGMFFWRVDALLGAFEAHQPAMAEQWRRLRDSGAPPYPEPLLSEVFDALPALPIDTAIMERAERVATVVGRFGWDDVGSWDALPRFNPPDASGNCSVGPAILVDSRNNIIYNEAPPNASGDAPADAPPGAAAPDIVLFGIHDCLVVRTDKAILIAPRSKAQGIKDLVAHLIDLGRDDLV